MINLSVSQQVMRPQERRLLRQQRLPEPATGWQHAGTWAFDWGPLELATFKHARTRLPKLMNQFLKSHGLCPPTCPAFQGFFQRKCLCRENWNGLTSKPTAAVPPTLYNKFALSAQAFPSTRYLIFSWHGGTGWLPSYLEPFWIRASHDTYQR